MQRIHHAAAWVSVVVLLAVALPSVVQAADEPWIPLDKTRFSGPGACLPCHYGDYDPTKYPLGDETLKKYGPHGYYFDTTNRCVYCHTLHEAEEMAIFQETSPTAVRDTISELCYACHDNTGQMGVYSQLTAFGFAVNSEHSVDNTVTVPGSNLPDMKLTCTSCHTPHNNTRLAGNFVSFSPRNADGIQGNTTYETNRLLRDDVGGKPKGTYTEYGGAWCAGCHDRRHSASPGLANHPTSETAYQAYSQNDYNAPELSVFIFDPVAANAFDPDGRVSPRPNAPRCQQCHENNMNVEGAYNWTQGGRSDPHGQYFERTVDPDGPGPSVPTTIGDSFPHQTTSANLLVETGDDLCLNCHSTNALP